MVQICVDPLRQPEWPWQLSYESVLDGLQVLHLCDHPWCVRQLI